MTTDGVVVVRPQDLKGRLTLRIDPKSAVRIRGQAIDEAGKAVAGARVTLRWNRQYPGENDLGMRGTVGSASISRRPATTVPSCSEGSGRG